MQKTIYEIIKEWIKLKSVNGRLRFAGHIIQTGIPGYGQVEFGVLHTPDSYSRAWRRIRETKMFEPEIIISEEDGTGIGKKEKYYIVEWRVGQLNEVSANTNN